MKPQTTRVTRRRDRGFRAVALAAQRVFSNCLLHNPGRLDIYLNCAYNLLFTVIRAAAPGGVPVPEDLNRSTISSASDRFEQYCREEYAALERQAQARRRPVQTSVVAEAMAMLPAARGGRGAEKFQAFALKVPRHLRPILNLMVKGLELLHAQECDALLNDQTKDKPGK